MTMYCTVLETIHRSDRKSGPAWAALATAGGDDGRSSPARCCPLDEDSTVKRKPSGSHCDDWRLKQYCFHGQLPLGMSKNHLATSGGSGTWACGLGGPPPGCMQAATLRGATAGVREKTGRRFSWARTISAWAGRQLIERVSLRKEKTRARAPRAQWR